MDLFEFSNVVELLIEWKFEEEVQLSFLNADIELQQFLNMGLGQLREFVPDDEIRLRLVKQIFKYKRDKMQAAIKGDSQSDNGNDSGDQGDDLADSDFDLDHFINKSGGSPKGLNQSSSDSESETLAVKRKRLSGSHVKEDEPGPSHFSSPTTASPNAPSAITLPSAGPSRITSATEGHSNVASTAASPIAATSPSSSSVNIPKRLNRILADTVFINFDLLAYLSKPTRKYILVDREANCVLTRNQRKGLVKLLAAYMLNTVDDVRPEDFKLMRAKIGELWPQENLDLIYLAPRETGIYQALARGSLFDAVRNKISHLIKTGARQPKRSRKSVLHDSTEQSSNQSFPEPEVQAALSYVKRAREITPDLEDKWKLCSKHRLNDLYTQGKAACKDRRRKKNSENHKAQISIQDYFDEFKVLKNPKGFTLLTADFKLLHSSAQDLFEKWPTLQVKLEWLAVHGNLVKDKEGKALLSSLTADDAHLLDENQKDAILLQLLPCLCPPTGRVNVGKQQVKPSVDESRDAFIAHATIGGDIEPLVQRRKDQMAKWKATLQPFMIFQGPSRSEIVSVYIAVDNILYKLDSALQCLDTCFKIYHSLCVGYPPQARHLWFIFDNIYGIPAQPLLDGEVPMSTLMFLSSLKERDSQ